MKGSATAAATGEPETDGEPGNRADHKGHDGFIKRNAEVAVDFAARKPLPNTLKNDHRFAEKEGGLTVVGEEKRRNKPGLCHRPPKDEDRSKEPPLPNSNLKTFALHDVSPSLSNQLASVPTCARCSR